MINNRHGPHPALSFYRQETPPGREPPAWMDYVRTGNAERENYARGTPPKAKGPPWVSDYNGPPGKTDYAGPPWVSDYTGPPGKTKYAGPPWHSDYTGPPGRTDYAGPPWVSDYTGPPGSTGVVILHATSRFAVTNKHGPPGCAMPVSHDCNNAAERERYAFEEVSYMVHGAGPLRVALEITHHK